MFPKQGGLFHVPQFLLHLEEIPFFMDQGLNSSSMYMSASSVTQQEAPYR